MNRSVIAYAALVVALLTGAPAAASDALPSPLGVQQAADYARAHRLEVRAARLRASALGERPAIASALEDPVIAPSVDHLPFALHGVDVSLAIEQQIPLSGIRGERRRAAEADATRAGAEGDRVALDVALDAKLALLMLREKQEMARVLEDQRALAGQVARAAVTRYSTGGGTQADVLRAEIEVARLDGQARSNAAEIRAAEVMLNVSLGREAHAPLPPLDSRTATAAPPSAETTRVDAVAARPELRAGAAEIGRADAEIEVMESMYSPMAMVRTGPAYTMADGAGWMLMVGVSLPIWHDRLAAGVREAEAMANMARADVLAMRRMIEGEALSWREQVDAARERYLTLRDRIAPLASQAIEPSLASYASGQLPLVSVIEIAQAQRSAQIDLIMARRELDASWARLARALGDAQEGR